MAKTPVRGIRVEDDEWEAWSRAAEAEQVSVSEWVRMAAELRLADLVLEGQPRVTTVVPGTVKLVVPADSTGHPEPAPFTAGGPGEATCHHPRRFREVKGPLVRCSPELGGCGAKL